MSVVAVNRNHGLVWPSVVVLLLITVAVLQPMLFLTAIIGVGLLVCGLRYPVVTAALVLVAIPVIDQAVAESESAGLFGAFRFTPAVALKAMMSFVVISYLWRNRINPFRYRLLQPLLIWLAYTGFTCLLFHDRALAVSMWLRLAYWVLYFVFFFLVAVRDDSPCGTCFPTQVRTLWRAGLAALTLFSGSVFVAKLLGRVGDYYHVGESYGFYPDPWNMAMTLPGVLVLALLYPWISGKRGWARSVCTALACATITASFMTFTRTSLIACFAAAIIFLFALKRVVMSRETRVLFALALIIAVGTILFVYRSATSATGGNQVAARWSEVDKGDIGSGRLEVFYAAWTKFVNASAGRKLLGHGIGAGPEAAEELIGIYVYLHDDLLEMLVCAGVVGLVLYCWFFARAYRAILAGIRAKSIWAVSALVAFVVYNVTSISYMRIYAVTPNTYFALAAGTSLGMLHLHLSADSTTK